MLGAPRGIMLSPEDRERTAYHESGHALVGMLTPDADPVRKVSIIPRGMALGVTLSTPDADRVSYSREDLEAKIRVALGGRGGGGDRLRQDHHRRRIRHPAADPDRPPDGRPLGDERQARADRRAAQRGRGAVPTRASARPPRRRSSWSTRRSGGSSRRPTSRSPSCSATTATSSTASPTRCSRPRRSTQSTPTPRPACRCAPPRAPTRSPRPSPPER